MGLLSIFSLVGCHSGGALTNDPSNDTPSAVVVPQPTIASPSTNPFYSQGNSLTISGMCQTGATVKLSGTASDQTVCLGSVYSFTVSKSSDGFYPYFISQIDGEGVQSIPLSLIWARKTSIALPVITSPVGSPYLSALASLTLNGNCETGATVTLTGDGTGTTTCANSGFSFNLPKGSDGDYNLQITQTDAAGNSASVSMIWQKHALTLTPTNPMLLVNSSQPLTISGGSGSYTVAFTSNLSGAAYNATTGVYTAGTTANVTDVLTATDSLGTTATISISVIAGTADHLAFGTPSGDAQVTNIGQAMADPMKIQVVDQYGNGIPNFPLLFQKIAGDAEFMGFPIKMSDMNGYVSLNMRMGYRSLVNLVRVLPYGAPLPDVAGTGNGVLNLVETSTSHATGKFGAVFQMGPNPGAVVSGDFDNDGKLDVAALSVGDPAVDLFLGKGNFLFQNMVRIRPICLGPNALTAADFNNDGNLDLAVVCSASDTVSVLLGTGTGGFGAAINISVPNTETLPTAIASADFNADGKMDFAITGAGASSIGVYFGNGNGTFASPVEYAVGASPNALVTGDFNKDGKMDLLVVNTSDNSFNKLTNDGTGGFNISVPFFVGNSPVAAAVADFNADSWPDVAVINSADGNASVLLNNTLGGFDVPNNVDLGSSPCSLIVSDINGDGKLDIAAVANGDNSVSIVYGTGAGIFTAGQGLSVLAAPVAIAKGDLNADGRSDLIVAGSTVESIQVLPVQASGVVDFVTPVNPEPVVSAVGDFNSDGKSDLAVVSSDTTLSVLLGDGKGLFTLGATLTTDANPSAIAVEDMSGDGLADIIVLSQTSGTYRIWAGNGNGTFRAPLDFDAGPAPIGMVIGNFNTDFNLDIIAVNATGRISFLGGIGDGTGGTLASVGYTTANDPVGIVASDFNGDKKIDIAVASRTTAQVSVLLGNGNGVFQNHVEYATGNLPSGIIAEDLNNDGVIDLATANENDSTVTVLLGNGDGSFGTAVPFAGGTSPTGLLSGDFNGDGKIDMAAQSKSSKQFTILYGTNNGLFNVTSTFDLTGSPNQMQTGDFNSDGAIDFSFTNSTSNSINIWVGH